MTRKLSYIFASLSLITLSACQHSARTHPENMLRVDIGGDVTSFDPQKMVDLYTFRVLSDLDEGLIDMDQANRPIPGMAQSWHISADGKTYLFQLRKDLYFSDGTPLRAEDFVYSWQRLADPKTAAYTFVIDHLVNAEAIFAGKLAPSKLGVKALSDYVLEVKLATPDPAFLAKCTTLFTTAVPRHTIEQYGESWSTPQHLVSTGAYALTDRVVNGPIFTTKNLYFYQANQVEIPQVIFTPYVDRNAALAAYKSGSIDISGDVPVDQYSTLIKQYPSELHTVKMEGIAFYSLNTQLAALQNRDLRQALSMAIDRDTLAYQILANGQTPNYSYVTSTIENGRYAGLDYAWSKLSSQERIAKAQQLYALAGYNSSNPLKLDILYNTNDASRKVALAIAAMWQKNLGVVTSVHNQEWKVYLQSRRTGQFEVLRNNWGAAYNFVTTYTPEYACGSDVNVSGLCLPDYDKLIHTADREQNSVKQTKLYRQAINLAMEQYAIIPLYQNSYTTLVKPYVTGLQIESNLLDDIRSKWIKFSD